jgi:hypothetical protein
MPKGQTYNINPLDPFDPETDRQTAARWRRWAEREEAIAANKWRATALDAPALASRRIAPSTARVR